MITHSNLHTYLEKYELLLTALPNVTEPTKINLRLEYQRTETFCAYFREIIRRIQERMESDKPLSLAYNIDFDPRELHSWFQNWTVGRSDFNVATFTPTQNYGQANEFSKLVGSFSYKDGSMIPLRYFDLGMRIEYNEDHRIHLDGKKVRRIDFGEDERGVTPRFQESTSKLLASKGTRDIVYNSTDLKALIRARQLNACDELRLIHAPPMTKLPPELQFDPESGNSPLFINIMIFEESPGNLILL